MKMLYVMLQLSPEQQGGGMYIDMAEELAKNGNEVTIIAPDVNHKCTFVNQERGFRVVRVASKETQGIPNMIQKGIALATLALYYRHGYDKYLHGEHFDWILMPTPPITLSGFVAYVKKKSGAKFYLILRDIHPQSIWSIGLLKRRWMYRYLDRMASVGYTCADLIGCMSQGNIEFIANQYPVLDRNKLVILYNWLKNTEIIRDDSARRKYNLSGKFVVLFGGTIGKGQMIENLLFLAEHYQSNDNIIFLIVGKGVEKNRLMQIAEEKSLGNILFLDYMPQVDYLNLTCSVDMGLITINDKYMVPTCPSKAVAYMAKGVPILAIINPNNDYGRVIENAGAGYWTVGADKLKVIELFDKMYGDGDLRASMSRAGRKFYEEHCTTHKVCCKMIEQMLNIEKL